MENAFSLLAFAMAYTFLSTPQTLDTVNAPLFASLSTLITAKTNPATEKILLSFTFHSFVYIYRVDVGVNANESFRCSVVLDNLEQCGWWKCEFNSAEKRVNVKIVSLNKIP